MAKKRNVDRGHEIRPTKKSKKGAKKREKIEAEQKEKAARRRGKQGQEVLAEQFLACSKTWEDFRAKVLFVC